MYTHAHVKYIEDINLMPMSDRNCLPKLHKIISDFRTSGNFTEVQVNCKLIGFSIYEMCKHVEKRGRKVNDNDRLLLTLRVD
jgi:hypothetical protein